MVYLKVFAGLVDGFVGVSLFTCMLICGAKWRVVSGLFTLFAGSALHALLEQLVEILETADDGDQGRLFNRPH
jgi:hypothetical protein